MASRAMSDTTSYGTAQETAPEKRLLGGRPKGSRAAAALIDIPPQLFGQPIPAPQLDRQQRQAQQGQFAKADAIQLADLRNPSVIEGGHAC